jgi:hypothetical protein
VPKINVLDTEDRWDNRNEDEYLWWPRVQWIDPGTVSGVAVVWFDPWAVFEGKTTAKTVLAYSEMFLSGPENGPNGQINRYLRLLRTLNQTPGLASGCESFTMRQLNQDWEFLAPVRIRAGLEARMSMAPARKESETGITLFTQSPSDALTTFTNDRLKAQRMYTPGPDHINDAKRHCLLWIRKLRNAGIEFFEEAHGDEPGWWDEEDEQE